jgi:DNA-binding XRE family transcriptional regulator
MQMSEDSDREFGKRLNRVREYFGLTEHEAAQVAGVTIKTWKRWEAGLAGEARPMPSLISAKSSE